MCGLWWCVGLAHATPCMGLLELRMRTHARTHLHVLLAEWRRLPNEGGLGIDGVSLE